MEEAKDIARTGTRSVDSGITQADRPAAGEALPRDVPDGPLPSPGLLPEESCLHQRNSLSAVRKLRRNQTTPRMWERTFQAEETASLGAFVVEGCVDGGT